MPDLANPQRSNFPEQSNSFMRSRYTPLLLCIVLTMACAAQDAVLIPFNATWRYLDNGTNQGTA